MLKEYVKQEFLDLPEKLWYSAAVIGFIIKAIEHNTDVYDAIVDIDHAALYQYMAENENYNTQREMNGIKSAMLVNAKNQISLILEEIEEDLECDVENPEEMRQEFEATEARAINEK